MSHKQVTVLNKVTKLEILYKKAPNNKAYLSFNKLPRVVVSSTKAKEKLSF